MKEKEQPIDPKVREVMNDIGKILARAIKEFGGEEYLFALFVFQAGHGEHHRINYISNANREDMLATLKEFIAKHEWRFEDFGDFTKRKPQ